MVLRIKKGVIKDALFPIALLLIEYINTYLREFGYIPVSTSIVIRELIFVVIFVLLIVNILLNGYKINKLNAVPIVLYLLLAFHLLIGNGNVDITAITNVLMPGILIVLSYNYTIIEKKRLNIIVAVFFCVSMALYLLNVILGDYRYTPAGLNSIYYFLLLTPYVLAFFDDIAKWVVMIPVAAICVISFKATAIMIIAALLLVYYFLHKGQISIKIIVFPIVLALFIFIAVSASKRFFGIDIYNMYVRESVLDGGNGRTLIWNNIINMIKNRNFINFLFGEGYNAVSLRTGLSAHNDFLEILYDFGVIPLILYIVCLIQLFLSGIRKPDPNSRMVVWLMFVELIIMLLFSNSIFQASYYLLIIFVLYCIGNPADRKDSN